MIGITFPRLDRPELLHIFTAREDVKSDFVSPMEEMLDRFFFPENSYVTAEQPHSNKVAVARFMHRGQKLPGVDALITNEPGVTLVIRSADCGPLFLYDPVAKVVGLAHSGRKGTEANVARAVIRAMEKQFRSKPSNIIAVLGPCIRPPHYEVDFATEIGHQCQKEGVTQYIDSGLNTGADPRRFFSYRMEKGKTGRHYSAICLKAG